MDYRSTWMSLLGLTLLLIAPTVFSHSMNAARKQEIFNLCYGRQRPATQITPLINGQVNPPLASSVENLIALIEKIENSTTRTTYQAKDLAATLLRKFRSDGNVIKSNSFFDQDEAYFLMDKIEDALLDSTTDVNFDDSFLSENERCSLYYMLSYNINQTEKASSTSSRYNTAYRAPTVNSRPSVGTPRYGNSVNYAPVSLTVKPREYGVGSFRGYTKNAIALNRLLLGVIAGQINSPGVAVRDAFTKVKPDVQLDAVTANIDDIINPLVAVTLSNIMATAAVRDVKTAVHGVSGFWDSAACSMEYTLNNENPSEATMANIRGGIDGYYIGELAKSLSKTPSGMKLRLSQILRYYYDNVGGRMAGTGYCDKSSVQLDYRTIKDTALNYYKVYEIVKGNALREETATFAIDQVEGKIKPAYDEAKIIPIEDGEYCSSGSSGGGMGDKYNCETPTDLFVAIDLQSGDVDKYKNLTARLINNLNLGVYGSSATVLSLNREDTIADEKTGQTFINNLKHMAWATYNKGCPGCAMVYPKDEAFNAITTPSAELYNRINSTLRDFEASKWHLPATPSRPFIIMGGSYSRSIDQNIRTARSNLKANHRDVQIFLLTSAAESDLTEYINAPEDVIKEPDGSDIMVKELSEKICKVPAVFQYANCRRVSTESNNAFEGYITPGKTQYWAMYPEYFLKSYDISMKFYSAQGNLEVCFGRYPNPETTGRCYGNDEETRKNGEIRLYVSNPCQDRDLLTCEPFYFTISMSDQGMTANNMCLDKKCLNAKQAKFKFTHTGIQCSSAFSLVSSLYLAFMLALLSSFYSQSKQF